VKANLAEWVWQIFGFKPAHLTLPHGIQDDTETCVVATANTLEHFIFGVELYTHLDRERLRIQGFVRLGQLLVEEVSYLHMHKSACYSHK
jgi:hypothetical protein